MRAVPALGVLVLAAALGSAAGCKDSEPSAGAARSTTAKKTEIVGVRAEDFVCDSLAKESDIEKIVGAEAKLTESMFQPPLGVARPCNYLVAGVVTDAGPTQEAWSFDIDCRSAAVEDAAKIMKQWEQRALDQAEIQAKVLEEDKDAGSTESAYTTEISIGRGGLDHSGGALVFVDDDAPCHVRVIGPDAEKRARLAKLLNERLTATNAPVLNVTRRAVE